MATDNKSKITTQYKTAVFQIHNPSKRKQAILNHALYHAHVAYDHILKKYLILIDDNMHLYVGMKATERNREIGKLGDKIDYYIRRRFAQLGGATKFGIQKDCVAQLKSYVELKLGENKQDNTGHPTTQRIQGKGDYAALYDDYKYCLDLDIENTLRDKTAMVEKTGKLRPLEFPVSHKNNGFLLLRQIDEITGKDKYYIWLVTHSSKSKYAKNPNTYELPFEILSGTKKGQFIELGKVKTGILCPINFGDDFQGAEFIAKGTAKTCKLVHITERNKKPCNIYEIHIAFEFKSERRTPALFLGVDRGIYELAAITVVDENGHIIEQSSVDGRVLRGLQKHNLRKTAQLQQRGKTVRTNKRRAYALEHVHKTANEIVRLADKYNAHIVMEDLSNLTKRKSRPKGGVRSNFRQVVTRQQYSNLLQIVRYKYNCKGFVDKYDIMEVQARYTSQTCPKCASWNPANRIKTPAGDGFDMAVFKCVNCGYESDADLNASHIIAIKGMHLRNHYKKGKITYAEHFTNYLKSLRL